MKTFALTIFAALFASSIVGCTSTPVKTTVDHVDVQRFMGSWYILAGRFTAFEKEVYNSVEKYSWNENEKRIDIDFSYRFGDFSGERRSLPQRAWIKDKTSNAVWTLQPIWPLKFDYLVLALGDDYSWAAVGVRNQKYLWIMARDWHDQDAVMNKALAALTAIGYDVKHLVRVPQTW